VKDKYRSASIVGDNRVVFHIKGNDYRLVVKRSLMRCSPRIDTSRARGLARALSGVLPAGLEKGNVLGVARRRAPLRPNAANLVVDTLSDPADSFPSRYAAGTPRGKSKLAR
jgi:hypothetical protein